MPLTLTPLAHAKKKWGRRLPRRRTLTANGVHVHQSDPCATSHVIIGEEPSGGGSSLVVVDLRHKGNKGRRECHSKSITETGIHSKDQTRTEKQSNWHRNDI
jgi:hypothetical protein